MIPVLRVLGIVLVYLTAVAAWVVLGGITRLRTDDQDASLRASVVDLFGGPLDQAAPTFTREWTELREDVEVLTDARGVETRITKPRWELVQEAVAPTATEVKVDLALDERRKGLMWYPLYNVGFDGRWTYTHDAPVARDVRLRFTFPNVGGQYDDFRFVVDGTDVARATQSSPGGAEYVVRAEPGQVITLEVRYRSRGMTSFRYLPTEGGGQVEGFHLAMTTDFRAVDFPAGTMSPTTKTETADGWALDWTFSRIVTGQGIGMSMPTRIQPGELASELAFSAPIPLALFFGWVFVLGLLRGIDIHPINYLFIAAAFVSFNLLFAYTADRLPVEVAFAVASAVSLFLVASYLRLVVGARFALVEAGLAQLAYQVGFGVAHFAEGYTGLTITVLGILTLFAVMQLTGRVRWGQALSAPRPVAAT